ncbi:tyrosine-type recombinase/integrase [Bacillus idriensis]|uniref:Tyrosine-type recombinase/integrase n=1 Tax=Metabacillus idriensis TaxID=324768 RepID=A0A6I2MI15_9BACI|nr:site-specific integrase [Metabacillus idriensis]MRX56716.1 tyrosine-type recombinase/integrase [Metabacillus idriensis]
MAHYRKRGKKGAEKWTYIIDLGIDPLTKKRRQISKGGFDKKSDARDAALKIEHQIANGLYTNESNISFQMFAQDWIKSYALSAKVSSVRARNKEMNHFIAEWGKYPLKQINKKMYQEKLLELSTKYSPNYLSGIHACGRMIFRHAVNLGYISQNPTEHAQLPKRQKKVEEIESQEEVFKFLEKEELAHFLRLAAKEGLEMDHLLFTTLSYTGLRIGELLALKWSDFDREKGTLRVTKTLYNPNNNFRNYELLTPKTTGSIRTLRIDEGLVKMLKRHEIHQKEIKMKNRNMYRDNHFIFARDDGYPQLRKVFEVRLKRLLKKAGITKNITPHSFRHTHTSLLIEAGVGIKEIQQRLGHTDINTTMNIYAHMTADMEEKASQQFSKLMKDLL